MIKWMIKGIRQRIDAKASKGVPGLTDEPRRIRQKIGCQGEHSLVLDPRPLDRNGVRAAGWASPRTAARFRARL